MEDKFKSENSILDKIAAASNAEAIEFDMPDRTETNFRIAEKLTLANENTIFEMIVSASNAGAVEFDMPDRTETNLRIAENLNTQNKSIKKKKSGIRFNRRHLVSIAASLMIIIFGIALIPSFIERANHRDQLTAAPITEYELKNRFEDILLPDLSDYAMSSGNLYSSSQTSNAVYSELLYTDTKDSLLTWIVIFDQSYNMQNVSFSNLPETETINQIEIKYKINSSDAFAAFKVSEYRYYIRFESIDCAYLLEILETVLL